MTLSHFKCDIIRCIACAFQIAATMRHNTRTCTHTHTRRSHRARRRIVLAECASASHHALCAICERRVACAHLQCASNKVASARVRTRERVCMWNNQHAAHIPRCLCSVRLLLWGCTLISRVRRSSPMHTCQLYASTQHSLKTRSRSRDRIINADYYCGALRSPPKLTFIRASDE